MRQKSTFVSLNVVGLMDSIKQRVWKFLQKEHPMCICLQETHLKEGERNWLKKMFKGDIFHAPSQTRSKGVMIGIAKDAPWETIRVQLDEKGRFVILKGKWLPKEILILECMLLMLVRFNIGGNYLR